MSKSNSFPGYPHLKRVTHSDRYGRMELLEVNATSDGFLMGMAKIGTGKGAYMHSVFLGRAPRPPEPSLQQRLQSYFTPEAA